MKARITGPSVFRLLWRRDFSSSASRRAINKIVPSAQEAIKDLKGSSMILVGGFGFSGVPSSLINAVRDRPELKDFTVVSNNAGMPGVGLGECFAFSAAIGAVTSRKFKKKANQFSYQNRSTSRNSPDQQDDCFLHWRKQSLREDVFGRRFGS